MNANKSFTFPTSLFLHTVLRPRNNGQLPEMDMRTGNPICSLKLGFRSGGFLSAEEFPTKLFLCQGCGKMETTGKEVDHSRHENRNYLHLLNFQARHVTTKPLFLDETRFKVFLLLLAPDLSSRIIIALNQGLQWEKRQKTGSNRKNIGERSKPSGAVGEGERPPFPLTRLPLRLASLADCFFRPRRFFLLFPLMRSLVPS